MSFGEAGSYELLTGDDLARVASGAPMVAKVRAFVDWVDAGRPLTQTGRLRRADALALVLCPLFQVCQIYSSQPSCHVLNSRQGVPQRFLGCYSQEETFKSLN